MAKKLLVNFYQCLAKLPKTTIWKLWVFVLKDVKQKERRFYLS